jgi:hypothetical protein
MWSDLYPGNYSTMQCLKPAVEKVQSSFDLAKKQRKRTVYRLDGGAGTDKNLFWLLSQGYQVIGKGFSARRANVLRKQVERWDPYDHRSYIGRVKPTFELGRPIDVIVKKRLHKGVLKYSYYVTTLSFPSKMAFMHCYDLRGAAEIEQFRADKSALHLSARRKRCFIAQKALILLNDLTHNLLSHFRRHALVDSPFAHWGLKRIVRDLFAVPGSLYFAAGELKRIELLETHPYAEALIICLEKYTSRHFEA